MTGQALIVQGDALRLPLPDASVDLIVTSPPYAFLRAYDTGYSHLEVGAEATPAEFLEHLWQATAEMVRVLKPSGSIFVDLGDVYSSKTKGSGGIGKSTLGIGADGIDRMNDHGRLLGQLRSQTSVRRIDPGVPAKSLMLLPERYRIGCVDQLGLIARAVIVWDKPNGLPESVTDRVRRSHEEWIHLVKQPRYYSAIDEVREPHAEHTLRYYGPGTNAKQRPSSQNRLVQTGDVMRGLTGTNPLGALPGSVWTIPSEPLSLPGYFITEDGTLLDFLAPSRGRPRPRPSSNGHGLFDPDPYAELVGGEDAGAWRWLRSTGIAASPWPQTDDGLQLRTAASHYAAFPSRWPEQLIKAFSPPGICLDCGQGRVPVVERGGIDPELLVRRGGHADLSYSLANHHGGDPTKRGIGRRGMLQPLLARHVETTILGYACACTPHTNHPGSGESRADHDAAASVATKEGLGRSSHLRSGGRQIAELGPPPKVGPWREYHLDGWRPPPTRPAVVLDPFSGVGTTPMVARALGRIGVGIDLSMPYSRAARWRVHHDADKAISRTWTERQGSLL